MVIMYVQQKFCIAATTGFPLLYSRSWPVQLTAGVTKVYLCIFVALEEAE